MPEEPRPVNENSLLEIVKRKNPGGKYIEIAERLLLRNKVLLDATFVEVEGEETLSKAWDGFTFPKDSLKNIQKDGLRTVEKQSVDMINDIISHILFYGDKTENSLQFDGLAKQYENLLNRNENLFIDAGGNIDKPCDIWMVEWIPEDVYMTFPNQAAAGLGRFVNSEGVSC